MPNRAVKIRSFLLDKIAEYPHDIVAVTAKEFSVSRTTIHRHLRTLLKKGAILITGKTSGAAYYLKSALDIKLVFNAKSNIGEFEIWKEYFADSFSVLSDNAYAICEHGFAEIFNNALDHSEGNQIWVETNWRPSFIRIAISDNGVGIFSKIKIAENLEDERESVLLLSRGKFTTDKENHSGEGIFFTSRAVDDFILWSHNLFYRRNNREDDWFLQTKEPSFNGTSVSLVVRLDTKRTLKDLYRQYTAHDDDEIPQFDKTQILVKLSKLEDDRFVSRSQAKRIVIGLDQFKRVILDFRGVQTVGQSFVDEVFRVFKIKHPDIKIEYLNASDDVIFMIERSLPM